MGGYFRDGLRSSVSVLRSLGPTEEDEGEDKWHLDCKSKELVDPRNQYQAVASKVSDFMVQNGKWDTCTDAPLGMRMPTHLISKM